MYLALKNALGKSFILFRGLLNKFSGATAAYSLRRLGSYNGPIVRIRRASDATEVNVGFNGTSSVDTTSPITVVSGSTTATTLGEFLTEDLVVFQPDYTTDDGIGFLSNMTSDVNQTVGGRDAAVKFSVVSTGSPAVHRGYLNLATPLAGTDGVKVTFEMYRPSGGSSQGDLGFSFEYGASTNASVFLQNSQDNTWEDFSFFVDGREASSRLYHQLSASNGSGANGFFFTGTTGDHIFIRNLKVEQINQGATVHTWYDQSGNANDATQSSTSLQPQIATSGSLNSVNGKPSIKWDGVDDFMVASISGFQDITNLSSFHVVTPVDAAAADTSTMTAFSFGIIGSGTNRGLSLASSTGAPGISGETITLSHESSGATTGRLASTSYSRAADTQSLLSLFNLSSGTSLFAQGSSVTLNLSNQINTSSDTSPSAVGFTSNNNVYLGGIFTTTPVALEEESFQEIIFFDANKTSDRTSIESNIDDYYDII